jgi:pilus assembly protein CpaB
VKKIRRVAIIAAVVLAISVYVYLDGLKKPVVQAPRSQVVLAKVAIKAGDVIKPDMVTMADLPSEAVLADAARNTDEVVGRISDRNTEAGEQLLVTRFLQLGSSDGGLSYVVQSGMRAITIPTDAINGVAGMIKPHNRVDLLVTIDLAIPTATPLATPTPAPTPTPTGTGAALPASTGPTAEPSAPPLKRYSILVMQNILVLAVGQATDPQKTEGKDAAAGAGTITLQVTPEQAQKLNLAASLAGAIRLTLRSPLDNDTPDLKPMDDSVFFK